MLFGLVTCLLAKTYDLGVKENRLDERVLLSIQTEVLFVFSQSENCVLVTQKEVFR